LENEWGRGGCEVGGLLFRGQSTTVWSGVVAVALTKKKIPLAKRPGPCFKKDHQPNTTIKVYGTRGETTPNSNAWLWWEIVRLLSRAGSVTGSG